MDSYKSPRHAAPGFIFPAVVMLLLLSCNSAPKPEGVYQVYKTKEGYEKMMSRYVYYLSKWPMAYQEVDVETSWGKTHVIKSGLNNKKPLIILHGGGSNAAFTCMPELARDYAVYNIDIPGEPGKSVPRRIPLKPVDLANWLNEVLVGLTIDRADILGLSYGGFAGQWFLNYYPGKVNKLVMIVYSYIDQMPAFFSMIKLLYYTQKNDTASVQAMIEYLNAGPVENQDIKKLLEDHFDAVNRYCIQERANAYESVSIEGARNVKTPVLIIMGEKDRLFNARKADEFCTKINNPFINFTVIKGMGHLPTDHLKQVVGLTLDFLKQKEDRGTHAKKISMSQTH